MLTDAVGASGGRARGRETRPGQASKEQDELSGSDRKADFSPRLRVQTALGPALSSVVTGLSRLAIPVPST